MAHDNTESMSANEARAACLGAIDDPDLQTIIQIAWVSAYRCPCLPGASEDAEPEFQVAWDAELLDA